MPAPLTVGFIDVATYDHLEIAFYGGDDAVTFYVRTIQKSTWATNVTTQLASSSLSPPATNTAWTATISRAGDYLLRMWLRVTLPEITVTTQVLRTQFTSTNAAFNFYKVKWCANVGHNIIDHAELTFNDLITIRFDNYFMDFWAAMTVPGGKTIGYNNMIGNIPSLNNPAFQPFNSGSGIQCDISSAILTVPIPISHFMNTGVSLPTAALPYNEMKLNVYFRPISSLLLVDAYVTGAGDASANLTFPSNILPNSTVLNIQPMAEYAIVSNPERKKMGVAMRDIPIKQMQNAPYTLQTQSSASNWGNISTELRFAHTVQTLFFALQNTTNANEWSNYTTLPGYYTDSLFISSSGTAFFGTGGSLGTTNLGTSNTTSGGTVPYFFTLGASQITGTGGTFIPINGGIIGGGLALGSTSVFIGGTGGTGPLLGTPNLFGGPGSAVSVFGTTTALGTMFQITAAGTTGGAGTNSLSLGALSGTVYGLGLGSLVTIQNNLIYHFAPGFDPITNWTLNYENTARHDKLEIDALALVEPYFKSVSIPTVTGLHTYNYTRDILAINGEGSTNYGKLTNVSAIKALSAAAKQATFLDATSATTVSVPSSLRYTVIYIGVNLNLVRASGGALGFPIL